MYVPISKPSGLDKETTIVENINSTRKYISNDKRPLNEGLLGNMRKQGQVDLVRNSESETSGVEKSPTSQNKFNALLHVVNEEDSDKYDDNSMNWEFVDTTQIIGDECDSFENSPDNNIKKTKNSSKIIGMFLLTMI